MTVDEEVEVSLAETDEFKEDIAGVGFKVGLKEIISEFLSFLSSSRFVSSSIVVEEFDGESVGSEEAIICVVETAVVGRKVGENELPLD